MKTIILSMKIDITDQSEEQKKNIFAEQESVLSNAEMLLEKRGEIIDQFTKKKKKKKIEAIFSVLELEV